MKRRLIPAIACLFSVALCLLYDRLRGGLPDWWRSHGGGIPYVLFWVLLWFSLLPRRRLAIPICIGCVLGTCLLEFGQLWNPQPLADFRSTRFGAALLGSGFDWADMPPYFIGGLVGFAVLLLVGRHNFEHSLR